MIAFFCELGEAQIAQVINRDMVDAYNGQDNAWYITEVSELCAELCKGYTQKDVERMLTDFFVKQTTV